MPNQDRGQDLNLSYLQVELLRIDILVRRAVRRWQFAGQNPADDFRGLYITPEEAGDLANRPLWNSWGSGIMLPDEEITALEAEEQEINQKAALLREAAQSGQIPLRLVTLQKAFGLSDFEYNAFLICLAPGLDPRYERLYAFLQDDVSRKTPSTGLVLDLLLPPGPERIGHLDFFRDQAHLLEWGLLKTPRINPEQPASLLRRELMAAPEMISWLAGNYYPAAGLAGSLQLVQPQHLAAPLLDKDLATALKGAIQSRSGGKQSPIMALSGPDAQRRLAAVLFVGETLAKPLLKFDVDHWKSEEISLLEAIRLVLRDAALTGAIPFFAGVDGWIDEEGRLPSGLLQEIAWIQSPILISSQNEWRVSGAPVEQLTGEERPILRWSIPLPTYPERLALWKYYLANGNGNGKGPAPQPLDEEVDLLSSQFILESAKIQDAVQTARQIAFQHFRPVNAGDLFEAARQQSSRQLDQLAVKIHPRYSWADIVLPDEEMQILREIAATIRERPLVLESWGLGEKLVSSPGVAALFAGPPGTGKTLAAQVIAEELGMDLYKIDLSSVVSKYIGETEKNLERIFSQAHNSNTVLFFDEADSIFGKRSEVKDAHDRYANIEVGYLLQRMESYEGVVILATNLRSNLDEAFTRRLQFIVDFPFPDESQRLNIWKVLFPSGAPREEKIDFNYLAARFPLAGGSIRNAIVSASFLAAGEGHPLSTRHLLHGVRRELQKMGRLINEKDLAGAS